MSETPSPISARENFERLAVKILDRATPAGELYSVVNAYASLLEGITGFSPDAQDSPDDLLLESGKAISPAQAARCVADFMRTARFVQGIDAAITEALRRFDERPLRILYAGTGPYATLILPLCTRYSAHEVRFTLIDIHATANVTIGRLLDTLALRDFIEEMICADATRYQTSNRFHIAITETMQQALVKEPQVAITANIASLLTADGILIPERITVDLQLASLRDEFKSNDDPAKAESGESKNATRIFVERLIDLKKETIGEILLTQRIDSQSDEVHILHKSIRYPALPTDHRYDPMLTTAIQIFGEIELTDRQSGITYPVVLHHLGTAREGEMLKACYSFGRKPGFVIEHVTQ